MKELFVMEPVALSSEAEAPSCRHHWIIEPPAGATSRGVCRYCGQERFFINSASDWIGVGEDLPAMGAERLPSLTEQFGWATSEP